MNDYQQATTNMWAATDAVLVRYKTIWQPRVPFLKAVTTFRDARTAITSPAVVQQSNTTGIAEDKETLELRAALKADYAGDIIQAYALDNNNNELYRAMMFSADGIMHLSSEASYNKMQEVLDKATTLQTNLLDYGLEAADVAGLGAAVAAYHAKLSAPRDATVQKSSATQSIAQLLKSGNGALYRMGKMINTFVVASPDFVREYKAARIIVNTGHSGGSHTGGSTPQ